VKCNLCGYEIWRGGTCQRTCKYDKKTGHFNRGKTCHIGCAEKHYQDHHDTKNPRSLASMQLTK
jgi:hypothetical protein